MLTEIQIIEKMKEIFQIVLNRGINLEDITLDSLIKEDLGLSSIGLIYLVIAIEETFEIEMNDVEFDDFRQIRDFIHYIQRKTG